jgi:hypothetical protein
LGEGRLVGNGPGAKESTLLASHVGLEADYGSDVLPRLESGHRRAWLISGQFLAKKASRRIARREAGAYNPIQADSDLGIVGLGEEAAVRSRRSKRIAWQRKSARWR